MESSCSRKPRTEGSSRPRRWSHGVEQAQVRHGRNCRPRRRSREGCALGKSSLRAHDDPKGPEKTSGVVSGAAKDGTARSVAKPVERKRGRPRKDSRKEPDNETNSEIPMAKKGV
mmetsp:Transcript_53884/g.114484  ORF Transcript_53884/g.114484 Transcript_53884/m.114484 type:complete len:115 (-) Transcript_53884:489-833(-)